MALLLEDNLPPSLAAVPRDLARKPVAAPRGGDQAPRSIFDNDEFDVIAHGRLDATRVSKGKRYEGHVCAWDATCVLGAGVGKAPGLASML